MRVISDNIPFHDSGFARSQATAPHILLALLPDQRILR